MTVIFIPPLTPDRFSDEIKIYRWYNLDRAIEIFEKNKLAFLSPSKWEDPYEKEFLKITLSNRGGPINIRTVPSGNPPRFSIFSQCWTGIPESEALWNVRTPLKDGLRFCINTSTLYDFLNQQRTNFYIGKVEYLPLDELTEEERIIELYEDSHGNKTLFHLQLLLFKRLQYKYEEEYRLFVVKPRPTKTEVYKINIDPATLFDNIKLHPNIGKYLEKHIKSYLHAKCGKEFYVTKSGFGKSSPIKIEIP